jgi:hypothetical protein
MARSAGVCFPYLGKWSIKSNLTTSTRTSITTFVEDPENVNGFISGPIVLQPEGSAVTMDGITTAAPAKARKFFDLAAKRLPDGSRTTIDDILLIVGEPQFRVIVDSTVIISETP